MINFDDVGFSERRSEEVISFFWRSVYIVVRTVVRNSDTAAAHAKGRAHAEVTWLALWLAIFRAKFQVEFGTAARQLSP